MACPKEENSIVELRLLIYELMVAPHLHLAWVCVYGRHKVALPEGSGKKKIHLANLQKQCQNSHDFGIFIVQNLSPVLSFFFMLCFSLVTFALGCFATTQYTFQYYKDNKY